MGIEYTARAGYGIASVFDKENELPLGFTDAEQWFDGTVDEWLKDSLYSRLRADIGGSTWTGDQNWRILARGAVTSVDKYSGPAKYFTELGEVDRLAQLELESLARIIDRPGLIVGWKLFWDVT